MTVGVEQDEEVGPDTGPSSIAKAVRVLRSLAQAGGQADGVTHIAALANLPKSTTHRVLSVLIGEGLVSRCDQLYRLGPGWFELQSVLSSSEWQRLAGLAGRPLAKLFEMTGATVHFAVLDGEDVLYLEKLTARGGTAVTTRVGGRKPALCTALGKTLLAHSDRSTLHSVLAKPLPVMTRHSIASPRMALNQLEKVRQTGLAFDNEEVQPGVFCVAAPVLQSGRAIAAVSVTRVGGKPTLQSDSLAVRRAASEIVSWLN
ncbi:IclR family transcriptional regulator [Mycolicibacterium sp. CH28]|uniref:IclR family transcriptional regulator n=1 Tax=Mycolicibacterium sp. CH28 TaxID=2512237 RepID=UPI001080FC90|nr:IclR family transcriptional regulator [Mycolicibacterium sp. CH28]TGD85208.1 IclR family transcriptional regulator [Mycolicibacterium sp. CH28]